MNGEERHSSAGALAAAFLLGGVVGAGLALLLTPRTGSETLDRIRENAGVVGGEVRRVAGGVRDRAAELLEKGRDMVEQKRTILESAIEAGKEAMDREKERLMARMEQERTETADRGGDV